MSEAGKPISPDLIVRIAARGEGVTGDGRFFPLTAPGDRIAAGGRIVAGSHRRVPPCRHFPECGGCQLQQLDDLAYAAYAADRIGGALAGQDLPPARLLPARLSPANSRRRAALSAERRGREVLLGFKAAGSHRIVDMGECHVLCPQLFDLVGPLRILLAGLLRPRASAGVRLTLADQGIDLLIERVEADGLATAERLTAFAATQKLARLAIDDGYGPQTRWEPEPVTLTLGGAAVPLPHAAFLQATAQGEAALVAAVRDAVGGARTVADLFAGIGTFAMSLDGRVYAAEGGREAVLALRSAAARTGRPLHVEHRDLYRRPLDQAELERFEAVVLDPPRAGAHEQVLLLAVSKVPVIAYVSCNPATFARDAKVLVAGGYRLDWVLPVGQFRWSTHVELAARFTREG